MLTSYREDKYDRWFVCRGRCLVVVLVGLKIRYGLTDP